MHGVVDVDAVAARHGKSQGHAALPGPFKDSLVTRLQALKAQSQSTQAIALKGVSACQVNHQAGGKAPVQLNKRVVQCLQVGRIGATVGQIHVQVTGFLAKGKIVLAVQGQGENAGVLPEDAGRAVALVHIQVDHSHLQRCALGAMKAAPFGLHQACGHGRIIENTKAAALLSAGVVRAAGHVGGHTGRSGVCASLQAQGRTGSGHRGAR